MHKAIEALMREHRVIDEVLGSLESFITKVKDEADVDREVVRKYADFFKGFAERCHHGKEEDRLFVKMGDFGFSSEFGPVAAMVAEHEQGRRHVRTLAAIGAGDGPLNPSEKEKLCKHAAAYVQLLCEHIHKEDDVLYPMALRALPRAELDGLADSYGVLEREMMGFGGHDTLHALARELVARFPPESRRQRQSATSVDRVPAVGGRKTATVGSAAPGASNE